MAAKRCGSVRQELWLQHNGAAAHYEEYVGR